MANTSFEDDYCELNSRFKASHVKQMCWWIAAKIGKLAIQTDSLPEKQSFYIFFDLSDPFGLVQGQGSNRLAVHALQDSVVMNTLAGCSWPLAKASELMDQSGLILSPEDASAAWQPQSLENVKTFLSLHKRPN